MVRNTMPTPTENRYGMYLTPEEAQNSELLRNLAAQQALQMQQAQLYAKQQAYSHGWADPRTHYAPIMVSSTDPIYKPKRQLTLPKLKNYHYLFAFSLFLVIIGVIFGA